MADSSVAVPEVPVVEFAPGPGFIPREAMGVVPYDP